MDIFAQKMVLMSLFQDRYTASHLGTWMIPHKEYGDMLCFVSVVFYRLPLYWH